MGRTMRSEIIPTREDPGGTTIGDGPRPAAPHPAVAIVLALTVAAISAGVFWPAVHGKWLNKDDDVNFTTNEHNLGFGADQLRWMFTTSHIGVYTPISWLTVAVDYELAKRADPTIAEAGLDESEAAQRIFHRTNVLFHAANSGLFCLIALTLLPLMLRPTSPAAMKLVVAAALFAALFHALHPLRAQTVAWVSARNNLVGALFFLVAVLCHLRAHGGRATHTLLWQVGGVLCYLLAALAKATTLPLPIVLLVLDWYPLRRFGASGEDAARSPTPESHRGFRTALLEKIPYFLVAVIVVVVTYISRQELHPPELPIVRKLGIVSYGLLFYPLKTLIPTGLSPYYPIPLEPSPAENATYVVGGIFGLLATVLAVFCVRRRPAFTATWLAYLLLIGLLLGFLGTGTYVAADRYSYLAAMPFALLLAGLAWRLWMRLPKLRIVWALGMVAALAACAWGTRTEIGHWRTPITVWSRVLEVFPRDHLAEIQLGNAYGDVGDVERAREAYLAAADPAGRSSRMMGRTQRYCGKAEANLGVLDARAGRLADAYAHFRKAIEIDTLQMVARLNMVDLLIRIGELGDALNLAVQSLELPSEEDPTIHDDLRRILTYLQQYKRREQEAFAHARAGRFEEATEILEEEIGRYESNPIPYMKLAAIYLQQTPPRHSEAIAVLERGMKLFPRIEITRGNQLLVQLLAWSLATSPNASDRDGERAVELAEALCAASGRDEAIHLDVLAAAYAEAGRFDQARATITEAIDVADKSRPELVAPLHGRRRLYDANLPYHQP